MKIQYQVEKYDQGVWSQAYCAMADSYASMEQRLGGEAGSPRLKTQYAILTGEDERRMPKEYLVKEESFNEFYNMHFDGMVTVNTENGTTLIPYLRCEADCYRTGAEDRKLCTKPLEILRELEAYRIKQEQKNSPSDYVIRVCEAIVARAGGFTGRNHWTDILAQGSETSCPGSDPHLMSILRDLEMFRKEHEHKDLTSYEAVEKCQEIVAMTGLGNPFSWRDILRGEKFEKMGKLFEFEWTGGSINDNIIKWCTNNGVDYRYDHFFRLQVNMDGTWTHCDYRSNDGSVAVYYDIQEEAASQDQGGISQQM